MIQPKVVLLIFVSGKIVLTGAKVRSEIYEAFNKIYNVLAGELLLIVKQILFWVLTHGPPTEFRKA
jgi:hypothetical protein